VAHCRSAARAVCRPSGAGRTVSGRAHPKHPFDQTTQHAGSSAVRLAVVVLHECEEPTPGIRAEPRTLHPWRLRRKKPRGAVATVQRWGERAQEAVRRPPTTPKERLGPPGSRNESPRPSLKRAELSRRSNNVGLEPSWHSSVGPIPSRSTRHVESPRGVPAHSAPALRDDTPTGTTRDAVSSGLVLRA
jgi:hypothetical protein